MNAEALLAHYERIAEAPDAVARLRRFILDLAVRGKLVPQDPNGERARKQLKATASESGKGNDRRVVASLDPKTSGPFELPAAWCWGPCRNGAIAPVGTL
jgi:type I restriction enzyme S subunit